MSSTSSLHYMPTILIGVTVGMSLQFHDGLMDTLQKRGWNLHVVASPGPELDLLSNTGPASVHPIQMVRAPSPLRDALALLRWWRTIRATHPDIVFVGTPKASLLGTLAARTARVHHRVYVLHGLRLETTHGMQRLILKLLERFTCNSATDIIAVSPSLRSIVLSQHLSRPDKVRVLGHGSAGGVDLARFTSAKAKAMSAGLQARLGIDPHVPVVGFVGRLTVDKGIPELTKALATMAKRGESVQLLVVGGNDDETDSLMSDLLGTNQKVVFAGQVEDPSPYYGVMSVLCLPTRREGFGMVVLEAMAAKVPVVTSDATGVIDLVGNGVRGRVFPRGNHKLLALALSRTLADPIAAEQSADRAFTYVSQNFEAKTVNERFADYLEVLLRSDPAYRQRRT